MKSFALALLASVAFANYGHNSYSARASAFGSSPYRSSGYRGPSGPSRGPSSYRPSPYSGGYSSHGYRPPSHPYSQPSPAPSHDTHDDFNHHVPVPKPYIPVVTKPTTYYAPKPTYYKHHAQPEIKEPWTDPAAGVDKSTWYKTYQQYSPARIAYKPTAKYPIFAVCELASGFVEFAQVPGKAVMIRSEAGLALVADTTYELKLREYGKIQRTGGGGVCEAGGLEFNPLTEVDKYGQVNPYQDPARGRIDDITADDTGLSVFLQKDLLQNIDGKDGILGRLL